MIVLMVALALAEGTTPGVTVVTDAEEYLTSDLVEIRIVNGLTESVFLPGCNQFLFERREGEAWTIVREKRCFWEGYMVEVAPGDTQSISESLEGFEPGTYRIRVDYHTGCAPNQPLSRAECSGQARIVSPTFSIE